MSTFRPHEAKRSRAAATALNSVAAPAREKESNYHEGHEEHEV
jgi:hypothetical protein